MLLNKSRQTRARITMRTVTDYSCSNAIHYKGDCFVGVREWTEVIGVMTDKENQGDEEVLIYAMTLINKVCTL